METLYTTTSPEGELREALTAYARQRDGFGRLQEFDLASRNQGIDTTLAKAKDAFANWALAEMPRGVDISSAVSAQEIRTLSGKAATLFGGDYTTFLRGLGKGNEENGMMQLIAGTRQAADKSGEYPVVRGDGQKKTTLPPAALGGLFGRVRP